VPWTEPSTNAASLATISQSTPHIAAWHASYVSAAHVCAWRLQNGTLSGHQVPTLLGQHCGPDREDAMLGKVQGKAGEDHTELALAAPHSAPSVARGKTIQCGRRRPQNTAPPLAAQQQGSVKDLPMPSTHHHSYIIAHPTWHVVAVSLQQLQL
jgi:hypothetical protein